MNTRWLVLGVLVLLSLALWAARDHEAQSAHAPIRAGQHPPTRMQPPKRGSAVVRSPKDQQTAAPAQKLPPAPHPVTQEHLALYRDVDLLDAAWEALQEREFGRARRLLQQHRRELARPHDDMNHGLSLLADCLEHPSAHTRTAAQHFYDIQTHSMVRRRLRRHCLQPPAQ